MPVAVAAVVAANDVHANVAVDDDVRVEDVEDDWTVAKCDR